jgi:Zn-dependent membrane protease YugP
MYRNFFGGHIMFMPFWDPTFILLIPAILFSIWAQSKVKSTYAKWSKIGTSGQISGADVARNILRGKGINNVPVKQVSGKLTDNYNPINRTLNLSGEVYNSTSIAAAGIAAHEAGHAIQHHQAYAPLSFRNAIFPLARFGSWLAFPLIILGIIFGLSPFVKIGIFIFSGFVAFTLITLPVEYNASKRAVQILASSGTMTQQEVRGARDVLNAAALTYLAAALSAVLNLLRLLLLSGSRD